MTDRPPYPRAPLALVVLEVRHPHAPELDADATRALKSALSNHAPILKTSEVVEVELPAGSRRVTSFPKLVARDKRTNVSFKSDSFTIETTHYRGWQHFRTLVRDVAAVLKQVAPVDGVERIGLRYIDEVRVPDASPVDWSRWISRSLLGPSDQSTAAGLSTRQQQCTIQYNYNADPNRSYTLRYGSGTGQMFQSNSDLIRASATPADEFFLIDTDGAWSDASGGIPEFRVDELIAECDRIHAPIKDLFESLITDDLRKVFDDE
ncbi:TIGR04255 family protein [Nocardia sp. AG03]|uniref:TIGR04255 family protein n=1 Tax=Nocardia sp. AG03 TaxID=3025312 RepID=UPI0024182E8E|nr:TIGR04255 family protein [Nocardia sp. AG03]